MARDDAHRELGGTWRAADATDELRRRLPEPGLDDRGWAEVAVPGHWRSSPELATSDGPVLYRRRFDAPPPGPERRSWLVLDGVFYQGDVWLDGSYLGDTEGYFFPHSFEVTERLRAGSEHLLAVEVACTPPEDRTAKRSLTGVFEHWDCIDPAWNPGGIWAPVRLVETGPVRIARLRVTCRDASPVRANLEVEVELDADAAMTASITTTVEHEAERTVVAERTAEEALAAGPNRVRWRVVVERPDLWWPHALGAQPLHRVTVAVGRPGARTADEDRSDHRSVLTGLRQVRMRDFEMAVNGERLFLKGANLGPTRRALAEATPDELAGDVELARGAGLDLLRIHAHVTRPELYAAADRAGMLLWQDLPLQWGYGRIRRQAVRQAREAVDLLAHHPSLAIWCGHNEPIGLDVPPGAPPDRRATGRYLRGQLLPSTNRTTLDRSVKRALDKADGSRPVVAHSGVWPHPTNGTDSHLYFGWYHGHERDLPRALARLPVLGRFVGEFGAQAVPDTADWMEPGRWPDLDWERLGDHHGLQREVLDRHVPRAGLDFDSWRAATQAYQATVVRHHVEALRRLKYRPTGGFCVFLLADAQPGVTWALLDHERRPKAAYRALALACAPVIAVADRPAERYTGGETVALDVHLVNDLRTALDARATASLRWPGGGRTWRWSGRAAADSVSRIGRVRAELPAALGPGGVVLDVAVDWSSEAGRVGSTSSRYEAETD